MTTINAQIRERAGKGTARATRRELNVPAVLYGNKEAPVLLAINAKELETLSRKSGFFTQLFTLKVGNDSFQALARDAQRHPVSEALEHVDFLRIDPKTKIKVAVPVKFINAEKSPGIKRGGMLNIVAHTIELHCLATKIPAAVELDLTGLEINDGIHSAGMPLPEGTSLVMKEEFTVATITAPSAVRSEMRKGGEAEAAAPAAAAAKPAAKPAAKK